MKKLRVLERVLGRQHLIMLRLIHANYGDDALSCLTTVATEESRDRAKATNYSNSSSIPLCSLNAIFCWRMMY